MIQRAVARFRGWAFSRVGTQVAFRGICLALCPISSGRRTANCVYALRVPDDDKTQSDHVTIGRGRFKERARDVGQCRACVMGRREGRPVEGWHCGVEMVEPRACGSRDSLGKGL